jgi:hypothetical protein
MSTELNWRRVGGTRLEPIDETHPLPVQIPAGFGSPGISGVPFAADYLWKLALDGRLFVAGDADQNDLVTAVTSFANTTPTFLLQVPLGTVALPLFVNLMQSGTVAGGDIDLLFEIDKVERYSTGGTSEKVYNSSTADGSNCLLWSNPTAVAGFGMTVARYDLAPDVSPAEGAPNGIFWKPEMPYLLRGPAAFLIYSYAASTAPSWFWNIGWAEFQTSELVGMR